MTVSCDVHGPMRRRPLLYWWECLGFDGEGCGVQVVYDEDLACCEASHIPGVTVSA